jgi:general stress protein 26
LQKYIEIMENSDDAYLATIDELGFPQIRCIFNLRNSKKFPEFRSNYKKEKNPFVVFIGTNTSSTKVRQVQKNPKIAIYYCIPEKFRGMMLEGTAEIIFDHHIKSMFWKDGWERYYPQGKEDPDFTLIKMNPCKARGWDTPNAFEFNIP